MKNSWMLHSIFCLLICVYVHAQEITADSIKVLNDEAFNLCTEYSFGKALSYSYIAIQNATNNDDDSSLASSYHVLGRTYGSMQYRDKAKKYYHKALKIHKELVNERQIVLLYHDLVVIYLEEEDFEKVHEYLEDGYKVAKESMELKNFLTLDWAKIRMLKKEERYQELLRTINEMIVRLKNTEMSKVMLEASINYLEHIKGDTFYRLGDYDMALQSLERDIKNENIHTFNLPESYRQLAAIYKSKGDTKKQHWAQLKYQETLKKGIDTDVQKIQEELLINYSLSEDQLKLDVFEKKNNQKSVIVNQFRIVLVIVILLLIGCVILGTLIAKAIYKKIKSNKLLRIKYNKLEEAKLKAEMTSKTKSNFFSMMSHELRTPLYAVTGITHLLLEENPKPSQQQYLKSLKFSGDHLLSLVNNILQANKLEDNTITIGASTFNLKTNIDNIIKSFDLLIKDRENELNIAYDKEIPELLVGDSLKISQILINLISNAIKFTKEGTIRLSVEKMEETDEDVLLHFCVQDTGIGIPKEKQEKVFEMFSQNYDEINQRYQGSGLGLSIVKKLLEVYNSDIHLESKENVGTTFTFDIRFPKTKDGVDPNIEVHLEEVDFSHLKMLVVDDNKINQMLTKKILSTKNISTDIVASGDAAIRIVKNNHYDVILMDIHMPEMDGYEATKEIRRFNKNTPIIAFTAVSLDDSLPKIINSGMNDMIIKPFDATQLFALIHKYM